MSLHVRHIDPAQSPRVQLKFLREDLLYKSAVELRSPDGKTVVPSLPIFINETGREDKAVGPTILDMLTRRIVRINDEEQAIWAIRSFDTLWPDRNDRKRSKREIGEKEKPLDHPFKPALASGGVVVRDEGRFVRIRKPSTVSISQYAYKLAVGMYGTADKAQAKIADYAARAWDADLDRSLLIFERVRQEGGDLVEDTAIERLRPASSISQQIEEKIMRKACDWFGVDPDKDVRRGRGRPQRKEARDEGKFVSLVVDADNQVTGHLIQSILGIKAGTDLADLDLMVLIDILGTLRIDQLDLDAALLESYLDNAAPDWREQAATPEAAGAPTGAVDPYEILGISPEATSEEVRKAWKKTMQQVHPDKGISRIFAQMSTDAYRTILNERGENE